jgi:hypothetical protein
MPPGKKAIALTSCAMPAFMARVFLLGMFGTMKMALKGLRARQIKSMVFGLVSNKPDDKLYKRNSKRQKKRASGW